MDMDDALNWAFNEEHDSSTCMPSSNATDLEGGTLKQMTKLKSAINAIHTQFTLGPKPGETFEAFHRRLKQLYDERITHDSDYPAEFEDAEQYKPTDTDAEKDAVDRRNAAVEEHRRRVLAEFDHIQRILEQDLDAFTAGYKILHKIKHNKDYVDLPVERTAELPSRVKGLPLPGTPGILLRAEDPDSPLNIPTADATIKEIMRRWTRQSAQVETVHGVPILLAAAQVVDSEGTRHARAKGYGYLFAYNVLVTLVQNYPWRDVYRWLQAFPHFDGVTFRDFDRHAARINHIIFDYIQNIPHLADLNKDANADNPFKHSINKTLGEPWMRSTRLIAQMQAAKTEEERNAIKNRAAEDAKQRFIESSKIDGNFQAPEGGPTKFNRMAEHAAAAARAPRSAWNINDNTPRVVLIPDIPETKKVSYWQKSEDINEPPSKTLSIHAVYTVVGREGDVLTLISSSDDEKTSKQQIKQYRVKIKNVLHLRGNPIEGARNAPADHPKRAPAERLAAPAAAAPAAAGPLPAVPAAAAPVAPGPLLVASVPITGVIWQGASLPYSTWLSSCGLDGRTKPWCIRVSSVEGSGLVPSQLHTGP